MKTADLHYALPESLIAQHPAEDRDGARLLVLDRSAGSMTEDTFRNLASYLRAGDCVAMNDTRVIRARLRGRRATGGKAEIFLLRELEPGSWEALVRPSKRLKPGSEVVVGEGESARVRVVVEEVLPEGRRRVRFDEPNVLKLLEASGEVPLPPYIRREGAETGDLTRYQTIYARDPGSVAAPTAGLHYTEGVLRALADKGVRRATLTLHVGYGTFQPVLVERLEDHRVAPEEFEVPEETAATLDRTRAEGGRVMAVGTTTTRVLETQYDGLRYRSGGGVTDRTIVPPYRFGAVDVLQTNFHLPRSSLLALVCAFGGVDFVLEAYRYAVAKGFRFYSYGDTMLIV